MTDVVTLRDALSPVSEALIKYLHDRWPEHGRKRMRDAVAAALPDIEAWVRAEATRAAEGEVAGLRAALERYMRGHDAMVSKEVGRCRCDLCVGARDAQPAAPERDTVGTLGDAGADLRSGTPASSRPAHHTAPEEHEHFWSPPNPDGRVQCAFCDIYQPAPEAEPERCVGCTVEPEKSCFVHPDTGTLSCGPHGHYTPAPR